MNEEAVVEISESLEALREWYAKNNRSPECVLAMKHYHAMNPAVAAELRERYSPGDQVSAEQKELAFVFALTQIADKLDMVKLLMANITVEHLPPMVPASRVDVTPLFAPPPAPESQLEGEEDPPKEP